MQILSIQTHPPRSEAILSTIPYRQQIRGRYLRYAGVAVIGFALTLGIGWALDGNLTIEHAVGVMTAIIGSAVSLWSHQRYYQSECAERQQALIHGIIKRGLIQRKSRRWALIHKAAGSRPALFLPFYYHFTVVTDDDETCTMTIGAARYHTQVQEGDMFYFLYDADTDSIFFPPAVGVLIQPA